MLNHVLLHQTVIGQEVIKQLEVAGADWPDIGIGCVGGGSNFGGFAFPFLRENIVNGKKMRLIAVEPAATPSITRGVYAYDYGDTAALTPIIKMHTLGHDFMPAPIHAGGLRYHGMAAQISAAAQAGLIEARNVQQRAIFDAALSFTAPRAFCPRWRRTRCRRRCRRRWRARERREQDDCLQHVRHGHFDLSAYERVLARRSGRLRVSGGSDPGEPDAFAEGGLGGKMFRAGNA